MNGEGWYLVKDTFTKAGETTVTSGTPAVVATTVNGLSNLRIAADTTTGQGNITTEASSTRRTRIRPTSRSSSPDE